MFSVKAKGNKILPNEKKFTNRIIYNINWDFQ